MARPKTLSLRQIQALAPVATPDDLDDRELEARPRRRSDCKEGVRPCPFVGCKFHLYLDVNEENGSLRLTFPTVDVLDMDQTCSLDVADEDGATLFRVGRLINLTRERIRQVEVKALRRLGVVAAEQDIVDAEEMFAIAARAVRAADRYERELEARKLAAADDA